MRNGSTDLRGVLQGAFNYHYVADLYYNGERRLEGVKVMSPRFAERGDANIQHSGSCTVVWTDEFATSLTPLEVNDPLAPFGAQLYVYVVVEAGPFTERVEYGRFLITDVPSARDEILHFRNEWLTVGSEVELELKDLLAGPAEESFDVPTAPRSLASAWAEVGVITGLPLTRTVPDSTIPRSVLHEDNKLAAAKSLMNVVLDAVPHMMADGTLGARPNVWGVPVDTVLLDCVVSVEGGMSAAQVYNRVVVRATGGDGAAVLGVAEVTSGPLRVRNLDGTRSPFGARTTYRSSEYVTTRTQAQAWANSELTKVSRLGSRVVTVTERFNPLRERGDVIVVERLNEWLYVRVVDIDRSEFGVQVLTVDVDHATPKSVDDVPFVSPVFAFYPGDDMFPGDDLFPGG